MFFHTGSYGFLYRQNFTDLLSCLIDLASTQQIHNLGISIINWRNRHIACRSPAVSPFFIGAAAVCVKLIAALMAAPDLKTRSADAQTLLNYGFSICRVNKDQTPPTLPTLPVRQGFSFYG